MQLEFQPEALLGVSLHVLGVFCKAFVRIQHQRNSLQLVRCHEWEKLLRAQKEKPRGQALPRRAPWAGPGSLAVPTGPSPGDREKGPFYGSSRGTHIILWVPNEKEFAKITELTGLPLWPVLTQPSHQPWHQGGSMG